MRGSVRPGPNRDGESGLLVQRVVGEGDHPNGLSRAFAEACGAGARFEYLGEGVMVDGRGAEVHISGDACLADGWVVLGSLLAGAPLEVVARAGVLLARGTVTLVAEGRPR